MLSNKFMIQKKRKNSWLLPVLIFLLIILYVIWHINYGLRNIKDSKSELSNQSNISKYILPQGYRPGAEPNKELLIQDFTVNETTQPQDQPSDGSPDKLTDQLKKVDEEKQDLSISISAIDSASQENNQEKVIKNIETQLGLELENKMTLPENPYNKMVANQNNHSMLKSKLNDYRIVLANSQRMLEKYQTGQNFANELIFFQKYTHPQQITEIVELLEQYLYLRIIAEGKKEKAEQGNNIFLQKFWQKFLHIKKIPKKQQEIEDLRIITTKKLPILIDYLYSEELQDNVIGDNFY